MALFSIDGPARKQTGGQTYIAKVSHLFSQVDTHNLCLSGQCSWGVPGIFWVSRVNLEKHDNGQNIGTGLRREHFTHPIHAGPIRMNAVPPKAEAALNTTNDTKLGASAVARLSNKNIDDEISAI